jgi:FSR family fosmidomycin resistance protein-like MFS transporter
MLGALALSSLGVAAFHPEAARLVNFAAADRHATGMSVFSVGGSVGFALAPLVTTALVVPLGRPGLAVLLAPVGVVAFCHLGARRRLRALADHRKAREAVHPAAPAEWGPFALLGAAVALRSAVGAGLLSFLALYWMNRFGQSVEAGNVVLAVLMATGIGGALLGGWLADRWGRRAVLRSGFFGTAGLLLLLGAADGPAAALAVVAALGLVLATSAGVQVVLGQEYLPGHVGTASGVTIGLAVSCGGLSAPLLGRAADVHGLGVLPPLLAGLALAAGILTCALPQPRLQRFPPA